MRLIDADAVMDYYCSECDDEIMKSCRADPCCSVMEIITEAKTVEAVPVRYGNLELYKEAHESIYKCTSCGTIHEYVPTCMLRPVWIYCPECGAKLWRENNAVD